MENNNKSKTNLSAENATETNRQNAKTGILNNKVLWTALSVLIAVISIWAVASQQKEVSFSSLAAQIAGANHFWLFLAVLCMLGYIVFEAWSLRSMCSAFGYKTRAADSCAYSAADIYFSAITPSATGGQPACAVLMMKDGMPGTVVTSALLINLMMYAISILVIGLMCFTLYPQLFMRFNVVSRVLIAFGYIAQILLAAFFFLLVKNEKLLKKICGTSIRLLAKLHLVHNEQAKLAKLEKTMQEYRRCAEMISGCRQVLFKVFVLNFMQRSSQIAVTMFVYLALGIGGGSVLDMWALQGYVVLGSNYVPVPGGMGIVDYLMLDGFGASMTAQQAVNLELVSRSLSFYCCILVCGSALILYYWRQHKKNGRKIS